MSQSQSFHPFRTNQTIVLGAFFIIGAMLMQACAIGDLVQQSEIRYPVNSTMETGRGDPPETFSVSIAGGAVYEEHANQFHLRSYGERLSGYDTTNIYRYFPDYFTTLRIQYAYSDNVSSSMKIFAASSPLQPLSGDTLFNYIPRKSHTLYGVEFGLSTYETFTSHLSIGFRLGFRLFEETLISKHDNRIFSLVLTTFNGKKIFFRIPLECVLNYKISQMEFIGGLGLSNLVKNTDIFSPNWLNYKFGIRSNTSKNWQVTLWSFFNGTQDLLYDRASEKIVEQEPFSPYLALQVGYYFHLGQ